MSHANSGGYGFFSVSFSRRDFLSLSRAAFATQKRLKGAFANALSAEGTKALATSTFGAAEKNVPGSLARMRGQEKKEKMAQTLQISFLSLSHFPTPPTLSLSLPLSHSLSLPLSHSLPFSLSHSPPTLSFFHSSFFSSSLLLLPLLSLALVRSARPVSSSTTPAGATTLLPSALTLTPALSSAANSS